jgi:hypothetical protein
MSLFPLRRTGPGTAIALLAALVQAASAASVLPAGDLAPWTCSGVCGASAAQGDIVLSPVGSPA